MGRFKQYYYESMLTHIYNLATDKYKGVAASIIKFFLFLLSLIYGLLVRIMSFVCRRNSYHAKCKVISVGNITLGGTGKTPLVEYIAKYLKGQGRKIAVISRGYKGFGNRLSVIGYRKTIEHREPDAGSMGDEAFMLQKNLKDVPVVVDADRRRGINKAVAEYGVDTVILDDAFQQWRIKKDLEIVVIDAANPFGNRNMIPRGILRQPVSSLKKADIFVLTKTNLNPDTGNLSDFLNRIGPLADIIKSVHKPAGLYSMKDNQVINPDILKGKTVTLVCGIGDPGSFKSIISGLNINIGLSFDFRDHHTYSRQDLDAILRASREKSIGIIITTEKDAVKLSAAGCRPPAEILVLRVELKITDSNDEKRFNNRLLKLYSV